VSDAIARTPKGFLQTMRQDIDGLMRRVGKVPPRLLPGGADVASSYRGTTAERDALWGVPSTDAEHIALANMMVNWFNTDLGWTESYYVAAGSAGLTVPGLAAGAFSGWYPTGRGPVISLLPSAAQSITSGMTFANWAPPGTGRSWRRGGAGYFTYASGLITCVKAGRYSVDLSLSCQNGSGSGAAYMLRNASVVDPHVLYVGTYKLDPSFGTTELMRAGDLEMNAGDTVRWYAASIGSAVFAGGADGTRRSTGEFTVSYLSPLFATE